MRIFEEEADDQLVKARQFYINFRTNQVIKGNLPSFFTGLNNFLYDQFRFPCYISITLMSAFSLQAYLEYLKHYFGNHFNKFTYNEMSNPNSPAGKMVANGSLSNNILHLIDMVGVMQTTAGIFQIFVCFRIIQLLCHFSRRLDTFAKTVIRTL